MALKILERHFKKKAIVISAILMTVLPSSTILYYSYADRSLGTTYAQKIRSITLLLPDTLKDSLLIFIPFTLVAVLSITLASILFTHRIAGPLVRVNFFLRKIRSGDTDITLKFRNRDVVKPLADSLNLLNSAYRQRQSLILSAVRELEEDTAALQSLLTGSDKAAFETMRKKALVKASEAYKLISEIKT
jgi:nitrogen fixation/metabolism regulation signal transduction histidine kinase